MTTMTIPKYAQNANRIIKVLAEQPDKTWNKTQRELGELLEFSQPELSTLLKTLQDCGKVQKGAPLPGVRGRNYAIKLVDATPLDGPVRRELNRKTIDRVLEPGEALPASVNLESLSLEHVGAAVLRIMKDYWSSQERNQQIRTEQMARIREFREQLSEERQLRAQLVTDKEGLERIVADQAEQIAQMRAEINQLIIKSNDRKHNSNGSYQVKDLLDDDEVRILENLIKEKPGFYRTSDKQVGLA